MMIIENRMGEPCVLLNEDHLMHNFSVLRLFYNNQALFPVIKAFSYGHGLVEVASILDRRTTESECPYFCVARVGEAVVLRQGGIKKRLLVLSAYSIENNIKDWPENVDVCISSWEDLMLLHKFRDAALKSGLGWHLNLDSGMHRLGLCSDQILRQEFWEILKDLNQSGLKLRGIMTHLASSEKLYEEFSKAQVDRFKTDLDIFKSRWQIEKFGEWPQWVHVANSEAIARKIALDLGANACRAGLHLWGVFATSQERAASPLSKELKPVLKVTVPLKRLAKIRRGQGVGYNQIFQCSEDRLIGTFAFGYADGIPRSLSRSEAERWKVGLVVEGVRMPFAGVVSMDLCGVDLTEHPRASEWSKALEVNKVPAIQAAWIDERQSVEEIADCLETISYEIFCRLSTRLKRIVVKMGVESR